MKYWIFSFLTAVLAYCFGNLNTMTVASRFVFRTNLRRLGRDSAWLSNFTRVYGVKGFVKLAIVELVKDAVPLLIASLLFKGANREVGCALAAFCLVLGRMYPALSGFRGSYAMGALCVSSLFISFSLGLSVTVVVIALSLLTRYPALGTMGGAAALAIISLLLLENTTANRVCIFLAILVIIRLLGAIGRIASHQEPRLTWEKDISYKFDEKF